MPYSPSNFPSRIEGKTATDRHYQGLPNTYRPMTFSDLTIYPMFDHNNWLLAEYRGAIDVAATDKIYNHRYCALFHLRNAQNCVFLTMFQTDYSQRGVWRSLITRSNL